MSSPCVYGQCNDMISSFQCRCLTGYDGIHCDNNIDDCIGGVCHNGATCTVSSYMFYSLY
jgi:Notch-like protein